jgi:RNA polymerase sigma-70 factor, ECF subfamily
MEDATARAGTWNASRDVVRTDESQSFDLFFLAESDRLLRALCLITGSRSQAEDIAQEAFTKVFERWDAISTMADPAGYLHRTAMNVFRSEYRRATRALKRLVTTPGEPDDAFASVLDRDEAMHALARLSPRQRAALVLTEGLGYSGEETGEILGIKSSTVHALTHQARAALSNRVEVADD